jgi:hypothetical protein
MFEEAKIAYQGMARLTYENVFWLNVAVGQPFVMHVIQGISRFPHQWEQFVDWDAFQPALLAITKPVAERPIR